MISLVPLFFAAEIRAQLSSEDNNSIETLGFKVNGLLGKGSHGVVYHATCSELRQSARLSKRRNATLRLPAKPEICKTEPGKEFALKIVMPPFATAFDPRNGWPFGQSQQECDLMKKAAASSGEHSNKFIKTHLCTQVGDKSIIIMDLVKGTTLKSKLEKGTINDEEKIKIATDILDCMSVMHGIGIVHGDLKEDNIMITDTNDVKIIDFGLATSYEAKNLSVLDLFIVKKDIKNVVNLLLVIGGPSKNSAEPILLFDDWIQTVTDIDTMKALRDSFYNFVKDRWRTAGTLGKLGEAQAMGTSATGSLTRKQSGSSIMLHI
jgi:serine/threonine protein kinase